MPATSVPNLVPKWVSATCEFLTRKNAAEPLLGLVHNGVAPPFEGIGRILPPWSVGIIGVGKNSVENPDLKEVKGKILERKDLGPHRGNSLR